VFTKKTGAKPDFSEPVVLSADRGGTTVQHLCDQLHRSLAKEFKCARHRCLTDQLQHQSMPMCMTTPPLGRACCRAHVLVNCTNDDELSCAPWATLLCRYALVWGCSAKHNPQR
jgi:TGS domain